MSRTCPALRSPDGAVRDIRAAALVPQPDGSLVLLSLEIDA